MLFLALCIDWIDKRLLALTLLFSIFTDLLETVQRDQYQSARSFLRRYLHISNSVFAAQQQRRKEINIYQAV